MAEWRRTTLSCPDKTPQALTLPNALKSPKSLNWEIMGFQVIWNGRLIVGLSPIELHVMASQRDDGEKASEVKESTGFWVCDWHIS